VWAAAPGAAGRKRGTMLMNRIGPSTSELFIADLDGGNERKLLAESRFDYNASLSADGRWLAFTSERNGDGQSDLFRAPIDGRSVQPLTVTPAVEDAGAISPMVRGSLSSPPARRARLTSGFSICVTADWPI
jgi:Tol biopolymer transport system component